MPTLFEYLDQYQNIPLSEEGLNEVDILILNEITYLPFDLYLIDSIKLDNSMYLTELYDAYWLNNEMHQLENPIISTDKRHKLFTKIAQSTRFQAIKISSYVNHFDEEITKQFCAVTYSLPDNALLICYRGTDDTLIGWQEDFRLAYQNDIPSQFDAIKYLNSIIKEDTKSQINLAGHSKGGNLALYAALNLKDQERNRLASVYLFDSPGLSQEMITTNEYQQLKPIIKRYIPEDSIVGKMLYHDIEPSIIKSSAIGLFQHDVVNWHVNGNQLERTDKTTEFSNVIDITLKQWCSNHSSQELSTFFNFGFSLLNLAGISTLNDISKNVFDFIKQVNLVREDLNLEEKETFTKIGSNLIDIWQENYRQYNENKIQNIQQNVLEFFDSITETTQTHLNFHSFVNWFENLSPKTNEKDE